ncbi:MAG TPA: MucR family transcriptional regulator [Caulobacteraceae bacterium]|jgi:predicted transcriptional regulator
MGNDKAVAITAELISAYLKNNAVGADDIPQLAQHVPELIRRIHEAFARLPEPAAGGAHGDLSADGTFEAIGLFGQELAPVEAPIPAVPIEESVTPDHVVCLEDGMTFRSLRPHLVSAHGLTPEAYRKKWGLAHDHPIVAPNYSRDRALVAKKIGLGKGGRGAPPGQVRKPK